MATENPLRIVFMGTPDFAVASLEKLHSSKHQVVATITAPDRPSGRGQILKPSAVKTSSELLGIPVLQPLKLKDPHFLETLGSLHADLFIVVAFRMLPQEVWSMPPYGTFNLHASLLPQYRGAAPINRALMNGETQTGITTFFLNEQIDAGRILLQESVDVPENMTAGELHDLLMVKGANLVLQTVDRIANQDLTPQEQQFHATDSPLKLAPKIFREDCRIEWNQSARTIHNHIRGLSPYPGAWTHFTQDDAISFQVKILGSEILAEQNLEPGKIQIRDGNQLLIGTGTDVIQIVHLQPEGKRPMTSTEFLRGFRGSLRNCQ